jgi:hypothetical protein
MTTSLADAALLLGLPVAAAPVDRATLLRDCTLLAGDAVHYSARPQFARNVALHGGLFVRVALEAAHGDTTAAAASPTFADVVAAADAGRAPHQALRYRAGRILRADLLPVPYRARGVLTDIELTVDTMPGARVRLTSISNSPVTPDEFAEYCGQLSATVTDDQLTQLAARLRAAWMRGVVQYVLSETEQAALIDRNEKLERARRNLANDITISQNRLEVALQQQQASQAAAAAAVAGDDGALDGAAAHHAHHAPESQGGSLPPSTQMFAHGSSSQSPADVKRSMQPLVDDLVRANRRFSHYIAEVQSSGTQSLVKLTAPNRLKNELLSLRGERLRQLRDERQGIAATAHADSNIWTLDAAERNQLAAAFVEGRMNNTSTEARTEERSAALDAQQKPQRILQLATARAASARSADEIEEALRAAPVDSQRQLRGLSEQVRRTQSQQGASAIASPPPTAVEARLATGGELFMSRSSSALSQPAATGLSQASWATQPLLGSGTLFSLPVRRARSDLESPRQSALAGATSASPIVAPQFA